MAVRIGFLAASLIFAAVIALIALFAIVVAKRPAPQVQS